MNYRPDIDGIRAIAVLAVILFHYGIGALSGGFVGVDVFFVLSGYLISSVIFGQLDKNKFEFAQFYFRRVRRLFPVYLVVMLVTFLFAYGFMLPRDFREFGQSLLASTLYMSNILFYMEAGYFDTASHLKPLLHTWSLSVEEQFYLVFPFLAWAFSRAPKKFVVAIFGLLTISSFIAASVFITRDNSAVFFLYPTRAWEMFLGTLLALRVIPNTQSLRLNNVLSVIGLLLIIVPIVVFDEQTLFPGLNALWPCLGTVLLLYSGDNRLGWVYKLLSTRAPVFIGKLSYSLYLWHWPVYVLYAYNKPEGVEAFDIVLMATVTFGLSLLSWHFIENPFREGKVPFSNKKSVVFCSTALLSLLCMGAGYYVHKSNGMPQRLDTKTAQFAEAAGDLFGDLTGCKDEGNEIMPALAYCAIGHANEAESYTLIWGDSHGGAYKRGMTSYVVEHNVGFDALLAWSGGCPPVLGIDKDENVSSAVSDARCAVRNTEILRMLNEDKRINAVVLVGRWAYYMNGGGVGVDAHYQVKIWPENGTLDSINNQAQFFIQQFRLTVAKLNQLGLKVFVVEQPPEFQNYTARPLAISLMNGRSDFESSVKKYTEQSYALVDERQQLMQAELNRLESTEQLSVLRTHSYFCKGDHCSLMLDNVPSYFDNNHVSSAGAQRINAMFAPLFTYLNEKH